MGQARAPQRLRLDAVAVQGVDQAWQQEG